MHDFSLVFGCYGYRVEDFVDCPGVENIILRIHSGINRYQDMMDYFDACRLFDKPLLEYNAIRHFIYNLQNQFDQINKPLWTQKKFELYQKFVIDHRHCGLYIKLALPEIEAVQEPPTSVKIQAFPKEKLKLIRGK